jgi:hypothetical protein
VCEGPNVYNELCSAVFSWLPMLRKLSHAWVRVVFYCSICSSFITILSIILARCIYMYTCIHEEAWFIICSEWVDCSVQMVVILILSINFSLKHGILRKKVWEYYSGLFDIFFVLKLYFMFPTCNTHGV